MAGYDGYSMSNNAREAYEEGEMPLSKWTKTAILEALEEAIKNEEVKLNFDVEKFKKIPVKRLKELCLIRSSWHHTGYHYNKTDFYILNTECIEKTTNDTIDAEIEESKKQKRTIKKEPVKLECVCKYLEWTGTRNHPKATVHQEKGYIQKNWFYLPDGSKKSIQSRDFEIVQPCNNRKFADEYEKGIFNDEEFDYQIKTIYRSIANEMYCGIDIVNDYLFNQYKLERIGFSKRETDAMCFVSKKNAKKLYILGLPVYSVHKNKRLSQIVCERDIISHINDEGIKYVDSFGFENTENYFCILKADWNLHKNKIKTYKNKFVGELKSKIEENYLPTEMEYLVLNSDDKDYCMYEKATRNDCKVTRAWKVYGADGHRQKQSFETSKKHNLSMGNITRIIEVDNYDKTNTHDYSILKITRNTLEDCEAEKNFQVEKGVLAKGRVGRIEEITHL